MHVENVSTSAPGLGEGAGAAFWHHTLEGPLSLWSISTQGPHGSTGGPWKEHEE